MRIDGSIPMHIARAYGVSGPRAVGSTPAVNAPGASNGVQRLVAATVRRPVEFSGTSGGAALRPAGLDASAAVLPLYTRSADLMEAAVGVRLGRSLDLRG